MAEGRPVLLIDTCAEHGSVALLREGKLLEERVLPERAASATVATAVREVLSQAGLTPQELGCVGVVSGPGSFTGVRVGLSFAKGLCLAAEVPLVTVSRLEAMAAEAKLESGFAAVEAGRAAVYVREIGGQHPGRERMLNNGEALALLASDEVALADLQLAVRLALPEGRVRMVQQYATAALGLVLEKWAAVGDELDHADANYVRDEESIYRVGGAGAPR